MTEEDRTELNHFVKIQGPTGPLIGRIELPFSKSIFNRFLVMDFLSIEESEFSTKIQQYFSENTPDDIAILRNVLFGNSHELNAGHAGTALRFGLAAKSLQSGKWKFTGSERLKKRPIKPLVDALRQLGAKITYKGIEDFLPLEVSGRKLISSQPVKIRGNISSQFISALLLIGPYVENGLRLSVTPPVLSKSYIEMTLKMMGGAGVEIFRSGNSITVSPGEYHLEKFVPERDWSAASYFLAALYLQGSGKLLFPGLSVDSLQGDSGIAEIFEGLGLVFRGAAEGLEASLKAHQKVKPDCLQLDFTDIPDMAQTFAALCIRDGIGGQFSGCDNLDLKETERLQKLRELIELGGGQVYRSENGKLHFDFREEFSLSGLPMLLSYNDHRMAMSQTLLSCRGRVLSIADPKVVGKSFPGFWEEMGKIGLNIQTP